MTDQEIVNEINSIESAMSAMTINGKQNCFIAMAIYNSLDAIRSELTQREQQHIKTEESQK